MAAGRYRNQFAVERRYVIVELAERWVVVMSRVLLLLAALGFGITTVVCALRGSSWLPSAGSSVAASLIARFASAYVLR
jgi:hypothetical protein